MVLDPRQTKWLNRFFPGLIEQVTALGEGEFEAKAPQWKGVGMNCVRDVQVDLKYKLRDGTTLEIRTHSRLRSGEQPYEPSDEPIELKRWERYRYALHYGKTFEDCFFRFDLDVVRGHHVHFKGASEREHVPATRVTPDTRDMDPRDFVQIVRKFRADKKYPLQRKTP